MLFFLNHGLHGWSLIDRVVFVCHKEVQKVTKTYVLSSDPLDAVIYVVCSYETVMKDKAILYVKAGCPWCAEATDYLDRKGIPYSQREVRSDPAAMKEMVALSGQTKAPTMKIGNAVLADFGVDELIPFLAKQNA